MRVAITIDGAATEPRDAPRSAPREEELAVTSVTDAAEAVAAALRRAGHDARIAALPSSPAELLAAAIGLIDETDVIFNLVESLGRVSEGEVSAASLLAITGLPVTGATARALALCLDKPTTRAVLAAEHVPIPDGWVLRSGGGARDGELPEGLAFPLIVKPAGEDASHGIDAGSVVHDRASLVERARSIAERFEAALVEAFVPGREIQVAMLGRRGALPELLSFGEIDYDSLPPDAPPILTYEAKWDEASDSYRRTPAIAARPLSSTLEAEVRRIAKSVWLALGLRGYARVDLRVHPVHGPYVIDVNPNPDLQPGAGLALAAARSGMTHDQLVVRILDLASPLASGSDSS